MSKCGKGCMPECEYFTTGGCISPFNCSYRIEELSPNSATSVSSSYVQNLISENTALKSENAKLRSTLSKMETVEKELRARLERAVELPYVKRDCELTQIIYKNSYGDMEEETYFHDCYYGERHDVRGDVYAEARLAELKGGRE